MKVLFETFTTSGHSESERILLNCVIVQCFNDTIGSSKSDGLAVINLWIPSNSGLHWPLSPHAIRYVTHNTISEVGLPCRRNYVGGLINFASTSIFIYIRHIWIQPVLCSRMVSLFHHTSP